MTAPTRRPDVVLNGPKIREIREFLGMTQTDLARAAGIKVSTLCNYEKGIRGNKALGGGRIHPSVPIQLAQAMVPAIRAAITTAPELDGDSEETAA